MSPAFNYVVGSQLRFLVTQITNANYDVSAKEIRGLVDLYGIEASNFLAGCLVQELHLRDLKSPKDQLKAQLFVTELKNITAQPGWPSALQQAFQPLEPVPHSFVSHLGSLLKLAPAFQVAIALALGTSENEQTSDEGYRFLKDKLIGYLNSFIQEGVRNPIPQEVLLFLLFTVRTKSPLQSVSSPVLTKLKDIYPEKTQSHALATLLTGTSADIHQIRRELNFDAKLANTGAEAAVLFADMKIGSKPASVLRDLGYAATAGSAEPLQQALSQFQVITEADVASMLGLMIRTMRSLRSSMSDEGNQGSEGWNFDVFVDCVMQANAGLDWKQVALALDHPEFVVHDIDALNALVGALKRGSKDPSFYPVESLVGRGLWNNQFGQLTFLRNAVIASPEGFNFTTSPRQQAVPQHLNRQYSDSMSAWLSLDLLEVLLAQADSEHYPLVRTAIEQPKQQCPELLLFGLAQVKSNASNPLRSDILAALVPIYLSSNANSQAVYHKLWAQDQSVIIQGMAETYSKDPATLSRLLEIAQDLKALTTILEGQPYSFTIDLAALASRREYLNLEKWLTHHVSSAGAPFVKAATKYLKDKTAVKPGETAKNTSTFQLSVDTLATFFKCLNSGSGFIPREIAEELKLVYTTCSQMHPRLITLAPDPSQAEVFSPEIDDEANRKFQEIYKGDVTVLQAVTMLQQYRDSSNQREKDVFACMIHNLFDEYRFFPKYPEKELRITGDLFGAIINQNLVSSFRLGLALRYVLEALRKPPQSSMYIFGILALDRFKGRLHEWPQYCAHITQMTHLPSEILQLTKRILADPASAAAAAKAAASQRTTKDPSPVISGQSGPEVSPSLSGGSRRAGATPGTPGQAPSLQSTLNIDTLLTAADDIVMPDEAVLDKIHFIFNNLSTQNMEQKLAEMKAIYREEYVPYLAQYLVVKRASIEPNFHQLYITFLTNLHIPTLWKKITNTTLFNVQVLLNSEKTLTSSAERSLLKNLGSWLGHLTIARNKPLLHKNLDLKKLIYKCYVNRRLIAVIPFVAKVLESCKKSKIFAPPNPWLMAVMGLLAELYHVHDLKLNLKFEIEVLCKNLSLELGDIKQTKMLNFRPRSKVGGVSFGTPSGLFTGISDASPFSLMSLSTADKTSLLIPPSSAKSDGPDSPLQETGTVTTTPSVGAPLGSITPGQMPPGTTTPGQASTPAAGAGTAPANAAANLTSQDYEATVIPNLASFVQINPAIALFHQEPNRRRVVPVAVDRAIREIISPVVERSVTIACITTRELCIKDFAMEPGETNIRKSAHLMVQHLAGSLALVTCKEPLRVSMSNHLRSLLQSLPGQDPRPRQIEEAVQVISAENLELGCTLIEKAATDKAIHDIDEALAPAYSIRHSHMEATGQPYYDHSTLNATRYPAALPKPLRPAPAAHRNNSVYDDFSRLMRSKTAGYPGSATGAAGGAPQAAAASATTPGGGPGSTPPGVVPVAAAPPTGQPGFSAGTSPEGPQGSINPGLLGQGGQQPSGAQQQASNSLQKGFASVADPVVKPNQTQQSKPSYETLTTQQCLEKFTQQLMELDKMLERTNVQDVATLPSDHEVIKAMSQVPHLITLSITRDDSALAFAQTIFKRLYVLPDPRHRSVHLKLLEAITGVCNKVIKELTSWVIYSDDERKFNRDVTPGLVRHRLLDVAEFDQHLAKQIDNSRNPSQAVDFAVYLVRSYLINEQRVSPCELINVLDVLHNVASFKGGGPELKKVVDQARSTQNAAILQAAQEITRKELPLIANPDDPDPNGFRDQVIYLFEEWLTLVKAAPPPESRVSDATAGNYIRQLMQHHLLANPDLAARFMRICTEVCLAKYLWAGQGIVESQHQSRQYQTLDAFAQLIVFVVQSDHFNPQQSLQLFKQALEGVTQVLFRDSQVRQYNFDQRPYHRLLATWLVELSGQNIDKPNVPIVEVLCQTLLRLQPNNSPGFAFSWLHLVSHRMLMPVLLSNQEQGWPIFHTLLCSLFVFLRPHLASAELNDAMRMMYKGTLRVLLVLLHDFPEYLCDFHFSLIDLIPTSCIQLRNLILSAFPRNMRLPDPFTPNLKVDLLPEISQPPRILSDYRSALRRSGLLEAVDQYLQTRKGLQNLVPRLTIPQKELKFGQSQYRISVLNALVLHVGMQAVIHLQQMKSPSNPPPHPAIQPSAPLDIFQRLVAELDSEGRYLFFNAIANQLRYPNNHTHYFSFVMLYLFKETRNEVVREQITRVLLERLIVNRPHPWGLLITFIELIKNPMYSFWSHEFTRCAPEIQRLFDSVARSCMGPSNKPKEDDSAPGKQQPVESK